MKCYVVALHPIYAICSLNRLIHTLSYTYSSTASAIYKTNMKPTGLPLFTLKGYGPSSKLTVAGSILAW